MVEEVFDLDRAVGRPRRVQVEVGQDPGPVPKRLVRLWNSLLRSPSAAAERRVDLLELFGDVVERLALDSAPRFLGELRAERLVLGEPGQRRGGQLGLLLHARRRGDRRSGRGRLEGDARQAFERRHEDRGLGQDRRPALPVPGGAHARPATELRRNRRPSGQLLRPEVDELPVRQLAEGALDCSGQRTLDRAPLEHDELPLLAGLEELRVHSFRDDPVLAREALGRGMGSFRRRGDERVDPPEQLLALRLRGRVPEPFGREEAGDAQSPRVPEREVREARQPRLEAVDDVELSSGERRGQVRADADREADPAPPRDRDGRAERDQRRRDAVTQRAPAGGEVCRVIRGREDADRVAALPECVCDAGDVFVHVVWLRPREGRHQADSQGHDHRV